MSGGKKGLPLQSVGVGGGKRGKQVGVPPTWLSQSSLGLAVLAQLGINHRQLGSHVTCHKGMNGQGRAGKRETRAGTARGWWEASQPGKPF